jgi:tape measure domain-containing protein
MVTEVVEIVVRERGTARAAGRIRGVGRAAGAASTSVRLLTRAVIALGAALSIRALLRFADTATRIGNQIRVVTTSTEEYVAVQSELLRITNETRTPLEDTVGLYRRFRIATRDLGTSQADVIKTVAGLNAGIAVSGATAQEARAGLIQLAQGLSSGRLAGDELRSVLENLAPVAQALADELGVTVGELREMGEAGELNAQNVFPALLAISDQFTTQLQTLNFTISQTSNVLKNNFLATIGELNEALGGSKGINGLILALAGNIRGILFNTVIATVEAFGLFSTGVETIASNLNLLGIEVLPSLAQSFALLVKSFQTFLSAATFTFATIVLETKSASLAFKNLAASVGLIERGDFAKDFEDLKVTQEAAALAAAQLSSDLDGIEAELLAVAGAGVRLKDTEGTFRGLTERAGELAQQLREARDASADIAAGNLEEEGENVIKPPEIPAEVLTALNKILTIRDRLRVANEKHTDEFDAQLLRLDQIETELRKQAKIVGDTVALNEALAELDKRRAQINENRTKEVRDTLAGSVTDSIGDGLDSLIDGKVPDFGKALADVSGNLLKDSIGSVLDNLKDSLSDLLADLGKQVGGLGESGFAALGAGLGLIGGLAASALSDSDSRVSRARQTSAVTSTQATRGVVAGPTNIPIFQVGDSIADGFVGVETLMSELVGLTRQELTALRQIAAGSGVGTSAGGALSISTPSLG